MADELKTDETTIDESKTETTTVNMTQSELESMINKKYAKGAEKATQDLLQTIGVDDIDTLKSLVTQQREAEEAQKTESQRLMEQFEALQAEKTELEQKLNEMTYRSEVQAIATENGIQDMDVFEYLYSKAKGQEGFDVKSFISELKSEKPYIFGAIKVNNNGGQNPPSKTPPNRQIKMADYVQLPASERAKYKANEIVR